MKNFIRKKEDFTCLNCGTQVKGNGYTNHCPTCLWSKHVDIIPGDRASECLGPMKPIALEPRTGCGLERASILHKCLVCSHEKRNEVSPEDSSDKMIELMTRNNP